MVSDESSRKALALGLGGGGKEVVLKGKEKGRCAGSLGSFFQASGRKVFRVSLKLPYWYIS